MLARVASRARVVPIKQRVRTDAAAAAEARNLLAEAKAAGAKVGRIRPWMSGAGAASGGAAARSVD